MYSSFTAAFLSAAIYTKKLSNKAFYLTPKPSPSQPHQPPIKMSPPIHKYNPAQLIFVKNVPQDSASSIANIYTQYEPLDVKNLYPTSQITTMMIALPTAEIAATALRCTDGMKVDNTIISVERYNARQSIVARRESRRKCNGEQTMNYEDDYDGYEADQSMHDEVPESWEDELAPHVPEEPVAICRETGKVDGVSWADVTKGLLMKLPSPPHAIATPAVTAPQTPIMAPASSMIVPIAVASQASPPIEITTAIVTPPSLIRLPHTPSSGTPSSMTPPSRAFSSRTPSPEQFHTAPQCPTPEKSSDGGKFEEDFGREIQVLNTTHQQRESLAWSASTDNYIRNRHCADCTFCRKRMHGQWATTW